MSAVSDMGCGLSVRSWIGVVRDLWRSIPQLCGSVRTLVSRSLVSNSFVCRRLPRLLFGCSRSPACRPEWSAATPRRRRIGSPEPVRTM